MAMQVSFLGIQKTYIQVSKKIKELEKEGTAPDWVRDDQSWIIGATWGLRLAMNWLNNNTLVDLPKEFKKLGF